MRKAEPQTAAAILAHGPAMKEEMAQAGEAARVDEPERRPSWSLAQLAPQAAASGEPLAPSVARTMGRRFGHDFASVRVHADSTAASIADGAKARAVTQGENIWFGRGRFAPTSAEGERLLAHELAHVVQQRADRAGDGAANEIEAKEAASEPARGGLTLVRGAARRGVAQFSPLSDSLDKAMASGGKAAVFQLLRERGRDGPISPTAPFEPDLDKWLNANFAAGTDDRWLAEQLIFFGSEPHWPLSALTERERRAHAATGGWGKEAGNIEGDFDTGPGRTSIKAYFFPGTTARRAMIIGGVHGSEASGAQVVNIVLDMLRAASSPPAYSLILVPALFPENVASGNRVTPGNVDPNRQMPAVGAQPGKNDSEGRPIEAENLVLLDLVERFQPERIATVHGNQHAGMASITSDPRPGQEPADKQLALHMAKAAAAGGARVPGNKLGTPQETATYPTSTAPGGHDKGVTFGEYGSHATATRPAMNVILIETQGNATIEKTAKKKRAKRKIELESFATVLRDVFLKT
jgi:hypothetical protein